MHIPPEVSPLSKKSTPFKAASAVIAGLLVLGSGIAVAGANSDDSTQEPVEVVSDPAAPSLVAEPGTGVDDGAGDETAPDGGEGGEVKPDPVDDGDGAIGDKPVGGEDPPAGDDTGVIEITDDDGIVTVGDDSDEGEVKEHPAHPANHGAQVSQAARQDALTGSDARNHGAAVSAVAKSKSHAGGNDDDKVKVDDDEDAAKDAAEAAEEAAKEAEDAAKEAAEEAKEAADAAAEAAEDEAEAAEVDED